MKRILTVAILLAACLVVGFRVIPSHTLRQLLQMPINEVWVDEGESIADAINTCSSGGAVILRAGTFTEANLAITKDLALILHDEAVLTETDSIFVISENVDFSVHGGTITQLDGTRKPLWAGDDISFYGTNINYYYINTDTSKGTDVEYWDECKFTRLSSTNDDSMMVRRDITMTSCEFYGAPIAFCKAWYDSCDVNIIDCYGYNDAGACLHPSASYGQAIVRVENSTFYRDESSLGYCVGIAGEIEFFAYNSSFKNKGGQKGQSTLYAHGIDTQDSTDSPNVQLLNCTFLNDSLLGNGYSLSIESSDTIIVLGLTANEYVWFDSTEVVGVGLGEPYIEYDGPPLNEIWIDPGESIANAVANCPTGGTVVMMSGTYTETDVTFSSAINVKAIGNVTWIGDTTLFTLGIDNVEFQGTIKDKFTLYCTHASAVVYDPNGKDYKMCGVIVRGKDILLAEDGVLALVKDVKLYPEGSAGARITGGHYLSEGAFQINEPVNIDIPDSGFGLNVTGGLGHFRGTTCIYVGENQGDSLYVGIDECIEIDDNAANVVLYADAICGIRGAGEFNAIKVSDGTFSCYRGEFANNSGTYPTVYYGSDANGGHIRYCFIQNADTSYAFASHATAGSGAVDSLNVINCILGGGKAGKTAIYGAMTYQTENVDLNP